jgi:iron complex outermembrane receptor protein
MGQFAFRQTSLDILPKFVSRQYLDNTQQLSRSIPSFLVFDLIANAPLKLKDKQFLTLRFGVQNLSNLRYASNGYSFSYLYNQNLITQNYLYPQAGRRWTIGLGIELQ